MKRLILFAFLAGFLALGANAQALTYSGTVTPGSGLFATEQWNDPATSLAYLATDENPLYAGLWYYEYTFTVPEKDISHLIIEVSNTFTQANIVAATAGYELGTFGTQGNSNPGIPDLLYGQKWEASDTTSTVFIVSDRAPMEGDFYSKDGKNNGYDVYAYTGDGSGFGANIVVPDSETAPIPEPGTVMLLGCGFMAVAVLSKRRITCQG